MWAKRVSKFWGMFGLTDTKGVHAGSRHGAILRSSEKDTPRINGEPFLAPMIKSGSSSQAVLGNLIQFGSVCRTRLHAKLKLSMFPSDIRRQDAGI